MFEDKQAEGDNNFSEDRHICPMMRDCEIIHANMSAGEDCPQFDRCIDEEFDLEQGIDNRYREGGLIFGTDAYGRAYFEIDEDYLEGVNFLCDD